MNKAFTKEDDGPEVPRLPDLPVSGHPNYVTPRGLAQLRGRLAAALQDLARFRAARATLDDTHPIALAERDIRYLEARLATAIPVDPAAQPGDMVEFGAEVTVEDEDGRAHTFRIVGEDEADAGAGFITPHSPLGLALIGERAGKAVEWQRPSGAQELVITAIAYPAD